MISYPFTFGPFQSDHTRFTLKKKTEKEKENTQISKLPNTLCVCPPRNWAEGGYSQLLLWHQVFPENPAHRKETSSIMSEWSCLEKRGDWLLHSPARLHFRRDPVVPVSQDFRLCQESPAQNLNLVRGGPLQSELPVVFLMTSDLLTLSPISPFTLPEGSKGAAGPGGPWAPSGPLGPSLPGKPIRP